MPKRIDDQTRFITFVMEGDLSSVEATLKNANAIFASRKKSAGTASGVPALVSTNHKPGVRRRRTADASDLPVALPVAQAAAATAAAVEESPEF